MVPAAMARSSPVRKSAVLALVGLVAAAASACRESPGVQLCGEIPEGGCPAGRGGSCDDAVCTGLYDCIEGDWTEIEHCPESPATTASTGGDDAGAGGAGGGVAEGGGGCAIPEIDHTGEEPGCTPDLQEPDCPAVAAEVCAPCTTGCVDFFLCVDDVWIDVAACTEDGSFVVVPR